MPQSNPALGRRLEKISEPALRFSVVIVLIWIGAMKFTAYEAEAIEGLVASSPLMNWLYSVFSQQGVSNLIGTIEILTGIALAIGSRIPVLGRIGAIAATVIFVITLTFLFTAPGWQGTLGGFPALSVVPGQFVLKDLVLLTVAVYLLAKNLRESESAA